MEQYMKQVETEIIVSQGQSLKLNELLIFPHGKDGFHIWEAGIILARFVALNQTLFDSKSVLELGTGVGIGGIAVKKFTNAISICMSDYKDDIVQNIKVQVKKNFTKKQIEQGISVVNLDWLNYQNYSEKFDVIIGSDLIYAGAPVEALYNLIKKALNPNGTCYIVIPSQRHFAQKFLEIIDREQILEYKIIKIEDQNYFKSPLANEKEGFKTYPGLKELEFYVYAFSFKKIENNQQ